MATNPDQSAVPSPSPASKLVMAAVGGVVVVVLLIVLAVSGAFSSTTAARPARGVYRYFAALRDRPDVSRPVGDTEPMALGQTTLADRSPLAKWASNNSRANVGLTPSTPVTFFATSGGVRAFAYVSKTWTLCVAGVNPRAGTNAGGIACGTAGSAKRADLGGGYTNGSLHRLRLNTSIVLVPNGVRTVTFRTPVDEHVVEVRNNGAAFSSTMSITASFTAPNGKTVTEPTAAHAG
jgi:hypothetical protein